MERMRTITHAIGTRPYLDLVLFVPSKMDFP